MNTRFDVDSKAVSTADYAWLCQIVLFDSTDRVRLSAPSPVPMPKLSDSNLYKLALNNFKSVKITASELPRVLTEPNRTAYVGLASVEGNMTEFELSGDLH